MTTRNKEDKVMTTLRNIVRRLVDFIIYASPTVMVVISTSMFYGDVYGPYSGIYTIVYGAPLFLMIFMYICIVEERGEDAGSVKCNLFGIEIRLGYVFPEKANEEYDDEYEDEDEVEEKTDVEVEDVVVKLTKSGISIPNKYLERVRFYDDAGNQFKLKPCDDGYIIEYL